MNLNLKTININLTKTINMYDSKLAVILWYLSWPIIIYISYKIVLLAVKFFKKRIESDS